MNPMKPRRLPDLPVFGGQPEEWPIFNCAFAETPQAYNCTDLENNQRLLKSLLIHPGNVSAVMENLRFRFGRPEQLIRSQLNSVREVPPISEQHLAKIVPFATRVSNLTAFLQSAKTEQHLGNPTLMAELVVELPTSKRVDWARHAASIELFPTVAHFSAWLQEYANIVCTILDVEGKEPRRRQYRRSSPRGGYRDERSQQSVVLRNSLERRAPQPAEGPLHRKLSCIDAEGGRLLFRILPITLYGAGRQVDTYALLDEGSSVTMIDDELRSDLGVRSEHRQLNIQWFGGKASREPTNVVRLEISGAGKPTRHALRNVYAVSSLILSMQTLCRRDVQGMHKDARLPMKLYSNVVPKLFIGLDHGHLGLPLRTRRFAREGPYAAATELGWVVFGPVSAVTEVLPSSRVNG
ncbi:uncharacterized protein [Drosophila kikkawai]|uniref:Peptidase A2 domain-containing protein n=1 Tax=Drosophila kikkawai TaxID=30033 RepID=A0ABM4GH72_DROKI